MPEAFLEGQRRTRVFPVARCGDDQQRGKLALLPLPVLTRAVIEIILGLLRPSGFAQVASMRRKE
jgi:hypothetical protein